MTWPALHISRSSEADVASVVSIAGNPERLPEWAEGLSAGIRQESGRWVSDSPMGRVEVAFTGPVEHGLLDHAVTLPDGTVIHNPLRVLQNDAGSEIVFTLYRRDGVSDEDFEADARQIERDLETLVSLVGRPGR
ncbi:SRPBCC family protein [Salinibacterium sp. SYSU T00001]|uniref:SRPBCC family protein n=1 Tax=Homoserinimonas sedimenticola TaxID=2986805 RepID=UPI0022365F83|nr:SRPBCC family protein [Salinibacterium sedimenticola]MCW4385925.1 SRPBCC family protein [Salinibacterium sedimenticola]